MRWLTFFLFSFQCLSAMSFEDEFQKNGYVEICNEKHGAKIFDELYDKFDEFIDFLQANPIWAQKLYVAKERFIRTKERNIYSSDFFGFYDESKKGGRNQISFYYTPHFHVFIRTHFKEIENIPEIARFFHTCFNVQNPYGDLFIEAASELGIEEIFASNDGRCPVLLKVIKYLPSYAGTKPHYDGTAFSLFLDSTDNESLLLSAYKQSYNPYDFFSPPRKFFKSSDQSSILLIPGALLEEFSIYPTPHIVIKSGQVRYATVAFAMRPYYTPQKVEFTPLPDLNLE